MVATHLRTKHVLVHWPMDKGDAFGDERRAGVATGNLLVETCVGGIACPSHSALIIRMSEALVFNFHLQATRWAGSGIDVVLRPCMPTYNVGTCECTSAGCWGQVCRCHRFHSTNYWFEVYIIMCSLDNNQRTFWFHPDKKLTVPWQHCDQDKRCIGMTAKAGHNYM